MPGHRYAEFRIRQWLQDGRSVRVLEEIGEERPIACGYEVRSLFLIPAPLPEGE